MKKSMTTINRERRHAEAVDRQKKYDALSTEEKLKILDNRPGQSIRERARLNK